MVSTRSLTGPGTLSKSLPLAGPQFPHLSTKGWDWIQWFIHWLAKYALSTSCIPGLCRALGAQDAGGAERKESVIVGQVDGEAMLHSVPRIQHLS